MFTLIKRPLYVFSNKLRRHRQPVEWMKEKWIADFSKPAKSCFDIKPEISYNAYLEKGALFLGLKKKNCMAWIETVQRVYVDQLITARFRFDSHGGYCANGIMFRVTGQGTYYLALVSSKGYFRLDAVNNNIPQPLVGWTETPGLNRNDINLVIIAQGDHFIFLLNGKWIAEAHDASIPGGHLGFALVSYDEDPVSPPEMPPSVIKEGYVCQSWLNFLSVDARPGVAVAEYKKWNECMEISAESRLRLAESFAALDYFDAAHNQILKAWKQREEAAKSVMATSTEVRLRGELLFAARMALNLGQYATAEEYLNACLALGVTSADTLTIGAETAKLLSAQNKNKELAALLPDYINRAKAEKKHGDLPPLYALLGHAFWNLQDYKAAADAWVIAFRFRSDNGLYAANAANAFEQMGNSSKALQYYLEAAQCFLQEKYSYPDLGTLVPKLLALGKNNREVQAVAAEWAKINNVVYYNQTEIAAKPAAKPKKVKPVAVAPAKKPKAKTKAVTAPKPAAKSKAKPSTAAAKKTTAKPKTSKAARGTKPKAKPGKTKK